MWGIRNFEIRSTSIIKFFFVQRISGLIILILFISNSSMFNTKLFLILCAGFLLFKSGGFPFQGWVIELSSSISLFTLFLFLTIQKILPFHLFSLISYDKLIIWSFLRWIILAFLSLSFSSLKKIIVISSTFFSIAILLIILFTSFKWKFLFLIYCFMLLPLLNLSRRLSPEFKMFSSDFIFMIQWTIVVGFLRGIPPMPAFFLKLEIFLTLLVNIEFFLSFFFLITRVFILYVYISIFLKIINVIYWVFIKNNVVFFFEIIFILISLFIFFIWV